MKVYWYGWFMYVLGLTWQIVITETKMSVLWVFLIGIPIGMVIYFSSKLVDLEEKP